MCFHTLTEREMLEDALRRTDKLLSRYSEQYRAEGRNNDMYRANTAWHNVVDIARHLRSLKTPNGDKPPSPAGEQT